MSLLKKNVQGALEPTFLSLVCFCPNAPFHFSESNSFLTNAIFLIRDLAILIICFWNSKTFTFGPVDCQLMSALYLHEIRVLCFFLTAIEAFCFLLCLELGSKYFSFILPFVCFFYLCSKPQPRPHFSLINIVIIVNTGHRHFIFQQFALYSHHFPTIPGENGSNQDATTSDGLSMTRFIY